MAHHPDTSIQAKRIGAVLKDAEVATTVFGARNTDHSKLNDDLGLPDDSATEALLEFVSQAAADAK